eukprot:73957-Hanusia_phi.AAC.2
MSIFQGMVFAFSGKFSMTQQALKDLVELGSGACAQSVTQKVTHLITTQAALDAEQRAAALATAIGKGLPLVREDFLSACVERRALVNVNDYLLRTQNMASGEDEEKRNKVLQAISRNIENRISVNLKRSVFYALEDYASCSRMATERLRAMRRVDLLSFGLEALASSRALDRINESMKNLRLDNSIEVFAARSLKPEGDKRMRLVIDTNIYLDANPDFCSWLETLNQTQVKVFIPIAVFEELDRKRSNCNEKVSFQARSTFRHIERALKRSNSQSLTSFWELQDRRVDDHYRRAIGGDGRSFDLRILSFLRDCHSVRKGGFVLVTEDKPLSLESSQHGIRTMSMLELRSFSEWRLPAPAAALSFPGMQNGSGRAMPREQGGRGAVQREAETSCGRSSSSQGEQRSSSLFAPSQVATGANAIALGPRRTTGRVWQLDQQSEETRKEEEGQHDLPMGWEVAYDRYGKKYYVDHVNRKTFYASSLKSSEVPKVEEQRREIWEEEERTVRFGGSGGRAGGEKSLRGCDALSLAGRGQQRESRGLQQVASSMVSQCEGRGEGERGGT